MTAKRDILIGLASFLVTGIAILGEQWLGAGIIT